MTSDSILNDVKVHLGVEPSDDAFDTPIIDDINATFMILWQLGVGPVYSITDANNKWSEYLGENKDLEAIKPYMYMRVRLMFDPPQSGTLTDALKSQIAEFEWRLNVECDYRDSFTKTTGDTDGK